MLKEIAMHTGEGGEDEAFTKVNCYLGRVHLSPVARLLNTYNSDGIQSNSEYGGEKKSVDGQGRTIFRSKRKQQQGTDKAQDEFHFDYVKLSQMRYDIDIKAEEKIAK